MRHRKAPDWPAGEGGRRDHGPDVGRARRVLMDKYKRGEDWAYHAIRRLAMSYRTTREDVAGRLLGGSLPWAAAADPLVAKKYAPPGARELRGGTP